MSKRKLTKQQAWRVKKIQEERAQRAEKRAQRAEQELVEGDLGPEQNGVVISHFGTQIEVEALEGNNAGERYRCHIRANLGSLVTGDRVVWREGKPTGVVVAVLERDSLLSRPDPHGQLKPVAANIDTIVIVIALLPEPHANLVDRYLVAAELSQIQPVILLNKVDLIDDSNREAIDDLTGIYPQLGYEVLTASTKSSHGLEALKERLADHTAIFVGQSGVGKSSLVNALLPDADLKVGELSEAKSKGTHTTTTARLFHFPQGGDLIDSPGIREFSLWQLTREELAEGFVEFRPHLGHCRFRNCQHEQEPDCAILAAVESGEISERRFDSYQQILNSLEESGS